MRKLNSYGKKSRHLTERINILITPQTLKEIEDQVRKGKFPNVSEFGRYCIRRYLDEVAL